jgi:formylmethanofuran dehydrogenase subunit C
LQPWICWDTTHSIAILAHQETSLHQHSTDIQLMTLTIRVREASSIPLEVDFIRLETVREQSADQVKATLIQRGNEQVALGDFFDVSGSASDEHIVWEGDCSRVKLIGTELTTGHIRVVGDAGMHLGAEMSGGKITVEGDATDWVGAEMHDGLIHVKGNAGHLVGAAYRGGRRGMTGGTILVDGTAGNEIGLTMRRGLIAIGGRVGDALGFNMIAGTIFVFGDDVGIRAGAGMRRGTIVYFGNSPEMLPTFRSAGQFQPSFLKMYLDELTANGFSIPENPLGSPFIRYNGDFLEYGKGEILVREAVG